MELNSLRKIIANSLVSTAKANELGGFNSSILPSEMVFEGAVLDAINTLRGQGTEVNPDNVYAYLEIRYNGQDLQGYWNDLLSHGTHDGVVGPYVYAAEEELRGRKQKGIIQKIVDVWGDKTLSNLDKYQKSLELFRKLAPRMQKSNSKGLLQTTDVWLEQYGQNLQATREGKGLGPRLPWRSAWKTMPYMRPSEIMVIAGQRGKGKSLIGQEIGIGIAHEQGYDVLYCHLETDPLTYMSRLLASRLLCPLDDLEQGFYYNQQGEKEYFDIREEPYKKRFDKVMAKFHKGEENGHFIYHHCPGYSVEDLALDIAPYQEAARENGRELVVMIDYFQNLRWDHYKAAGVTFGLNIVADELKVLAESYGINIIIMAQSTLGDEDSENDLIRSANTLVNRSQTVYKIVRTPALQDIPYVVGNIQQVDMLGQPIYLQRKGEHSSKTILKLVKANNSSIAEDDQCVILIANKYHLILEAKARE